MSVPRLAVLATLGVCLAAAAAGPEPEDFAAAVDAQGVQTVGIVGGSYFFRPARILAKARQPIEIHVRMEAGIIPHRFVLQGPDGKPLADVPLSTEARTVRLSLPAGDYPFHCPNQLLGFRSHRERGMAGLLRVAE